MVEAFAECDEAGASKRSHEAWESGDFMASASEATVGALTPYVGAMVADTCVRGTALSLGKTSEMLSAEDLPALEDRVRRLLLPLLPSSTIDRVITDIRGGIR